MALSVVGAAVLPYGPKCLLCHRRPLDRAISTGSWFVTAA